VAKKFLTSELARTVAEVAAMNARSVTTQMTGLRGWCPPPPPRKIPMFRRRLSVTFVPQTDQTLKIRHAAGHSIQNLGTKLNEIRSAQNRLA
jgi:hypothetical protein